MVEMKSGDTYIGTLETIDKFMNIKLNDVVFTSKVITLISSSFFFKTIIFFLATISFKEHLYFKYYYRIAIPL